MNNNIIEVIKPKIHTLRGVQVILDRDLSDFYETETRSLKQAIKRNIERFPEDFMFQLTENEVDIMVSQSVIPSKQHLGGSLPYAFTEQGVANISSILTSKRAIEVNIQIMRAFIQMRQFLLTNKDTFQRLNIIETKLLEHDNNFNKIFNLLETNEPKTGIFFNNQFFDSYIFITDLIRKAKNEIKLIDNYIDERTLNLFKKKENQVKVTIYTKNITKELREDINKFNKQYNNLQIKEFKDSHDRFLIIDDEVYHIGASLKDIGKKWTAFSKLEDFTEEIKRRLN